MHIRTVVATILRVLALFYGILAVLGFFALLGLAQVIPVLDTLGGGLSALMALIFGLFMFCISFVAAEVLGGLNHIEKELKEIKGK